MNINETLEQRQKTHGNFLDHAKTSMTLKGVVAQAIISGNKELTFSQREALDMICHKIARVVSGNPNTHDHWHDIAGYATLVAKELENDAKP